MFILKFVRRSIASLLCIALCMSLCVPVFAADSSSVSLKLSSTSLDASETAQTVTLDIVTSEEVAIDSLMYTIEVPSGWTVAQPTMPTGVSGVTWTNNMLIWYSSTNDVTGLNNLGSAVITVPAGAAEDDYEIKVTGFDASAGGDYWTEQASYSTTLTIKKAVAAEGYTATLTTSSANNEVVSEGSIDVKVAVSHSSDSVFNAGEIKLTYDSTKLTPDTASLDAMVAASTLSGYKVNSNELVIEDFGGDKTMSTDAPYSYSIPFTAAKVDTQTTDTVKLTRAAFIHKNNASGSDLIEATKSPESLIVTIKVAMVDVTLTNSAGGSSTTTTEMGKDYTFAPDDTANYTYSDVKATVDGVEVPVTDNGNGTFTIAGKNVTGDIEITYTKTAKSYDVAIHTVFGETTTTKTDTATYAEDYEFTVPENVSAGTSVGYTYVLASVTINGETYTGYSCAEGTRDYTIPGTDITGLIVITITKTEQPANTFTVTTEGNGAGNATINNTDGLVAAGETASITVTPEAGYTYTVLATMGGAEATVTSNGNTYSVASVNADVVFTVTKTLDVSTVAVYDYVTMDKVGSAWLVTFDGSLESGKVPTYDGNVMYWSDNYDAYCWLVIGESLDATDAKAKVNATTGTKVSVDYGMDINGTGVTDAADAQLVWNMYNSMYNSFGSVGSVKMEQFLAADQNAVSDDTTTWKLTVQDAQVIIAAILNGTTTN